MFVRAYLRASTDEQDANRARAALERFTADNSLAVAAWYVENESGAKLDRPELFRLLNDCREGDVLLVEQVDRLSRLNESDWEKLKGEIKDRGVRIVALDLPTSWMQIGGNEFTRQMLAALNGMMLDMLAAIARKDYQDRRRRASEGIEKRKREKGTAAYTGRKENVKRNEGIITLLKAGTSWSDIIKATGCSRSTIKRMADRLKEIESDERELAEAVELETNPHLGKFGT